MNQIARTCIVWTFLTISFTGSASERPKGPPVTVNVYNDAQVPAQVLTQAMQEATRIFRKIGVDAVWMECQSPKADAERASECHPPSGPTVLALRIVPWSSKLGEAVFGTAFLSPEGEGTYCDVFYDSVEKLHQDWHVSLSRVLGHTMAHEVGHLLLGTHAHSQMGIMRPNWQGQELRRVEMGALLFTPEQGRSIQTKLLTY
jgi:hypothetical protein